MKALLYKKLSDSKVSCHLCNHRCVIKKGDRGVCTVRKNDAGELYSLVYGKLIAKSIDPIEKKPLYHLSPGSLSYSIATVGCNFSCSFCQNSDIAQMPADKKGLIVGDATTPEEVVDSAIRGKCKSISYTYNEPAVFFEFALDTARLASEKGLKNVFVTNGYMTPEAIEMIAPFLDAANVDLKSYSDDFYKNYCGARLEKVKNTIKKMKSSGIFLEITTLIIPGLNDDKQEIELLAHFIADHVGTDTPWHISRFHPAYRLNTIEATPVSTLSMAREIGLNAGLKYVYTGNVPGDEGENTFCYNCGQLIIKRAGYMIFDNKVINQRCPHCDAPIDGVDI